MNAIWMNGPRSAWLDAFIAAAVGVVGQTIVVRVFSTASGSLEAVPGLLFPAAVGVNAALLTRRGPAIAALVIGVVLGFPLAALLSPGSPSADVGTVAVSAGAAALGFAAAFAIRMSSVNQAFQPPTPLDRDRITAELTAQLRSIDPQAVGSFERSITLLRQVNEHLQMYGPFSPWQVGGTDGGASRTPSDLLLVQAELVEAARMSALAAGARRVTITSSGMGLDVQAVFGDPIVGEPERPPEDGPRPL